MPAVASVVTRAFRVLTDEDDEIMQSSDVHTDVPIGYQLLRTCS